MLVLLKVSRIIQTKLWWLLTVIVILTIAEVTSLSGPNVCMVEQRYNITKRVKYRAPMSVRTYEWCFAMPPRCSKWNTEMRDATRLETEERVAEMAICCPGYKLKDVSCVPICPSGKTGRGCSEECPPQTWGPICVNACKRCEHGSCDVVSGECRCQDGWQGERCETSMTTTAVAMMEQLLTTAKDTASTKTTQTTSTPVQTTAIFSTTTSITIPTTVTVTASTEKTLPTSTSLEATNKKTIPSTTTKKQQTTQRILTNINNTTLPTLATTMSTITLAEEVTKKHSVVNSNYNRTEIPTESTKKISTERVVIKTEPTTTTTSELTTMFMTTLPTSTLPPTTKQIVKYITTTTSKVPTTLPTVKDITIGTSKPEITRKVESTIRPPTTKFKPKEIWIRPAQKGESPIIELKTSQELPHIKIKTKEVNEVTTPKTIIVSIIPTSVSYVTFKKLALTTASTIYQKHMISKTYNNRSTNEEFTKPITIQTTETSVPITNSQRKKYVTTTVNPLLLQNVTKTQSFTSSTKRTIKTILPTNSTTNSMLSTLNAVNKRLNSSLLTTISSFSTNANVTVQRQYSSSEVYTSKAPQTVTAPYKYTTILPTRKSITGHPSITKQSATILRRNVTLKQITNPITAPPRETESYTKKQADTNSKRNLTNTSAKSSTVTDDPTKDEETFHILTEPEHITAVMSDKGTERSTIDLISVISIAGGVMMAVITVAVVIVMLERCKRPRYEDVRKYNDIRMQVMIDKNDVPPPYVRSIFHTPLPDPPIEKCHYQPISTLDRNLKQFMRPVVVQTISPLMLENFRGILECHYDHLPRRSQDMGTMEARCSVAPSIDEREELLPSRVRSLTDADIEAMKCEATLDVLDNTTSEPLYAEIPCWRPPSARAIEVVNLNGEAVTEL